MKKQVVKLQKNTVEKIFQNSDKKNLIKKDVENNKEIENFLDEILERDFNAITLFR